MNSLRSFFTENIGLKLFSIGLAVVLWMVVSSGVTTEIVVSVPLEFRNVPANLRFSAEPGQVQVRVRGSRRLVRGAASDEFTVPVDLADVSGSGERTMVLSTQEVEAPASFQVMQIVPSHVRLNFESER